jgi:sec-independent protein translocase protein TatC
MSMLAIPMTILFLVSEVIARTVDRRRRREAEEFGVLDDDEISPLDDRIEDIEATGLSDEDD